MPRGKPRGAMVSSRPTLDVGPEYECETHIGTRWLRAAEFAHLLCVRHARGWTLFKVINTGVGEYVTAWRRRGAA